MPWYSRRRETYVWLSGFPYWKQPARRWILRHASVIVDDKADVGSGLLIRDSAVVTIGRGCYLSPRILIDASAPVTLEENVWIGDNVRLITGSHYIGTSAKRAVSHIAKPITIGAGTWLGSGVTVLQGVTVGEGCVVGACALVTKDLEANGLYVGSPARRVRDLDPEGEAPAEVMAWEGS